MNVQVNSKKVKKGDIFIAIPGIHKDGHDYINEAIEKGASKIIAQHGTYPITTEIVTNTKQYLIDYLKAQEYSNIKDLTLIGMTGTNGKTTTCYLLHKLLNQLGIKTAYIGTIGFYIDQKIRDLKNTTPDILDLYELLLESKEKGCTCITIECSSQALDLKRLDGLLFDYAIFSNLTKDHLDYHLDMKHYALAKQKLFTHLKSNGKAIINIDDNYHSFFLLAKNQNITYGFEKSDYHIIDYVLNQSGSTFTIEKNKQMETYHTLLLGKHNIYNLTSIIVILKDMGFDTLTLQQKIALLEAPNGRMDTISYLENQIIIDYAHTPDAVQKVIEAVKALYPNHIYTIIGCGGNRDKTKRLEMGKIATDYSNYVIFTSDNPRYEDPEDIIQQMITGLDHNNYKIEVNREKAIQLGIQMLEKNDILLLLGKGHETYQIIRDEVVHFDDKEQVMKYIRR